LDFWDITKLLVRRWQIALPMLLLSVIITAVTMSQVKPDYVSTAYVQLVSPNAGNHEPGAVTPDQQNQWIGLGLSTLGNAAIVQVMDQTVADEFKRNGFAETYTVTMGESTPLVTFEVTGSSKAQAKETTDALVTKFTDSVEALQKANGVSNKAIMITGTRLDAGGNVKKSSSKVKRALVAVAAAGLLLTAGATIGADAWLRRRQSGEPLLDEADEGAATSPLVTQPIHQPMSQQHNQPHNQPPSGRRPGTVAGTVNTGTIHKSGERPTPVVTGADSHGLTVEYQRPAGVSASVKDNKPGERKPSSDETAIIMPDAESTVVIPLAAMPPRPASAKRGKNN
jgi:capsular polysaccharide biosynthesis protein